MTPETIRARDLRRRETDAEYRLWYELRARRLNGFKFVRQCAIEAYVADFACRTHWLIVELDGSQHSSSRSDVVRTLRLNDLGWSVLRFWNEEVFLHREMVLDTILAALEGRWRAPGHGADPSPDLRSAQATLSPPGRGMAPLSAPFPREVR